MHPSSDLEMLRSLVRAGVKEVEFIFSMRLLKLSGPFASLVPRLFSIFSVFSVLTCNCESLTFVR